MALRKPTALSVLACCLLGYLLPAAATPSLEFSGFGTVGYAVLDNSKAEYRVGKAQDGADKNGTFLLDTRLGLQLDTDLTPRLSATVQALASDDYKGDFRPSLEWAFLQYLLTDTLSVRAGRMSLPVFALSDYRDVHYAQRMIRPPEDTYQQVPLRSTNGVDLIGNFEWGENLINFQALYGQSDEKIYTGFDFKSRDNLVLNTSLTRGPARVRLSHFRGHTSLTSPDLSLIYGGLQQLGQFYPPALEVAREFSSEPGLSRFSSIGLDLDFDRYFFETEFTLRQLPFWLPDAYAWHVAAGYRWGDWTPYVFASAVRERTERRAPSLPPSPLLAELQSTLDQAYLASDQQTYGIGFRLDMADNVALKAQLEHISRDKVGVSFMRDQEDIARDPGNDVTLFSFAVDFIF